MAPPSRWPPADCQEAAARRFLAAAEDAELRVGGPRFGASAKPKVQPAAKPFAAAVAVWRPEILAAAQDPDDFDVDEDLEAVAAAEALTVEEQQKARLRYLRERRQAALRAGPMDFFSAAIRSTTLLPRGSATSSSSLSMLSVLPFFLCSISSFRAST